MARLQGPRLPRGPTECAAAISSECRFPADALGYALLIKGLNGADQSRARLSGSTGRLSPRPLRLTSSAELQRQSSVQVDLAPAKLSFRTNCQLAIIRIPSRCSHVTRGETPNQQVSAHSRIHITAVDDLDRGTTRIRTPGARLLAGKHKIPSVSKKGLDTDRHSHGYSQTKFPNTPSDPGLRDLWEVCVLIMRNA
jgi:hypothetical protein